MSHQSEIIQLRAEMSLLGSKLTQLQDQKKISVCMVKYMALCDFLGPGSDLDELMSLFTQDAIWEGKGKRYQKTLGRFEGRQAIRDMFAKYTKEPGHFLMNMHLLGNEQIDVEGETGVGRWMLLQPSDFTDGRSQLSCAAITGEFIKTGEQWQISHFQTVNRFSRPMESCWNDQQDLPVPE